MASNHSPSLIQCTGCHEELNLESKTLPCLHSFCRSCLERNFGRQMNGNGHCPVCHESLVLDQLSLSPLVDKSLRRLQLESTGLKCDVCTEDGVESTARNWCPECQNLFCNNCCRFHNKFLNDHNMSDLNQIITSEVIEAKMMDMCSLHNKTKDLYCERCNLCLCDTCYQNHSVDSPGCSSRPLSVGEEALKQKSLAPGLAKEMDDLATSLRRLIERTENRTVELNADCDFKCQQIWEDFEEMKDNARRKTEELCEEMRRITNEQVKRWRHLLEENEKILKQLEIWRINLRHLLSASQQDVDVVCGLRTLASKLSSQLQKPVRPEEECYLRITFADWWLQGLNTFKTEKIGSVYLTVENLFAAKNIVIEREWNPQVSNLDVCSIHVSKEDDHIFLCNWDYKESIMEFTEDGEFVVECFLDDGTDELIPYDMCSISSNIFAVVAGRWGGTKNKLIFLERRKIPPFLEKKIIIDTEKEFHSVSQINKTIFVCDDYLEVDTFTKEGQKLETIKTAESLGENSPRICADPFTGNFWVTIINSSELFCYNPHGRKIRSVRIEEEISDFCVNELGHLYFCNMEGIFSFYPEKKNLYKFKEKSEVDPKIFSIKDKIFVYLKIDEEKLVKIFKIFY